MIIIFSASLFLFFDKVEKFKHLINVTKNRLKFADYCSTLPDGYSIYLSEQDFLTTGSLASAVLSSKKSEALEVLSVQMTTTQRIWTAQRLLHDVQYQNECVVGPYSDNSGNLTSESCQNSPVRYTFPGFRFLWENYILQQDVVLLHHSNGITTWLNKNKRAIIWIGRGTNCLASMLYQPDPLHFLFVVVYQYKEIFHSHRINGGDEYKNWVRSVESINAVWQMFEKIQNSGLNI